MDNDAAFVAERVLTLEQLKKCVDAIPENAPDAESGAKNARAHWRYVFGRRLVRSDRYAEAAQYLPAPTDKIVQLYAQALHDGADTKLSKEKRAEAWFHAAWIARFDGMELMGTEVAPDAFTTEGSFPIEDIAQERLRGTYDKISYSDGNEVRTPIPIPLRPSRQELQRLKANRLEPDVRFHYRLIAGALAMKAADLLPDQSEELADVINSAGTWVKDRDEKLGNRYFAILDRRAARTEIGRQASPKHWFVDTPGPWSTREKTAYGAMHKELAPTEATPAPGSQ
ncbi:MAG: hypothetical protein ACR2NX_02515 [Chthoniobacterales bacterium]